MTFYYKVRRFSTTNTNIEVYVSNLPLRQLVPDLEFWGPLSQDLFGVGRAKVGHNNSNYFLKIIAIKISISFSLKSGFFKQIRIKFLPKFFQDLIKINLISSWCPVKVLNWSLTYEYSVWVLAKISNSEQFQTYYLVYYFWK